MSISEGFDDEFSAMALEVRGLRLRGFRAYMIPLRDLWGIYTGLGFRGLGFRVGCGVGVKD